MDEQPAWNPYGQREPNPWQGQPPDQRQPPYPPQQPYGQQQPYSGQPPYQETPYGQPYQQDRPYGQQTRPTSGHRGRPWPKSWPRHHKVLTALGVLIRPGCGRDIRSIVHDVLAQAKGNPNRCGCLWQPARRIGRHLRPYDPARNITTSARSRRRVELGLHHQQMPDVRAADDRHRAAQSGTCTKVGYVADNPGYNVNAASAPLLKNVVTQTGSAC